MITSQRILCAIGITCFFGSCEYHPEAINFQEVDSVGVQTMQIALDHQADTLIVAVPTTVNFQLAFPKDVACDVMVTVGTQVVYDGKQKSGQFTIFPTAFQDGFYPMTLEVIAGTGTMSLADRLEVEKVLFQYQGKIVQVVKAPAQSLDIISVTVQEDGLLVTWPQYPLANLKEYVIYETVAPDREGGWDHKTHRITDRRQTSLVDHTYLGGKAEFRLHTVTLAGDEAWGNEYLIEGVRRPAVKSFRTMGVNDLEVKWSKSGFPSAFGSYKLRETHTYMTEHLFESTNISDTTCIIKNFPFGYRLEAELRTIPQSGNPYTDGMYSTYGYIHVGDKIPVPYTVLPVKSIDRIYYYDNGYIYAILHSANKPFDSIAMTLNSYAKYFGSASMSPSGEYLYVSSGHDLVRLDPLTLDEVSSIPLATVLNDPNLYPYSVNVSDGHRLIVDVKRRDINNINKSQFIAIIDGENQTVSDTIGNKDDVQYMRASDDQHYIFASANEWNRVFEISPAGQEVRRAAVSRHVHAIPVFTDNELYMIDYYYTTVHYLNDFSFSSKTSHIWYSGYVTMDPLTGDIGAFTAQDEYTIFEPLSLVPKHKIKIRVNTGDYDYIQLINNHLVSIYGYRLALP